MKMTTNHDMHDLQMGKATWFALGVFAGAAVALLASPASGRENRQAIGRRARQVGDYVAKEGNAFIESQRHLVADALDRSRSEVKAFGSRMTEAIVQGKTAYRSAREQSHDVVSMDGVSRPTEVTSARLG